MAEEEEELTDEELDELVKKVGGRVSELPYLERTVIELLWATKSGDRSDRMNIKQVADKLGKSTQEVWQLRENAMFLLGLKKPDNDKPEQ